MIRSYAFCFTNMLIHLISSLFHQGFGYTYVTSYTISVYCSIILLLVIPSIIVRTMGRSVAE
jgi:competence protein ComGC